MWTDIEQHEIGSMLFCIMSSSSEGALDSLEKLARHATKDAAFSTPKELYSHIALISSNQNNMETI